MADFWSLLERKLDPERWEGVEWGPRVKKRAIAAVEKELGALPPSYVRVVTERGLWKLRSVDGEAMFQMLSPNEAMEVRRTKLATVAEEIEYLKERSPDEVPGWEATRDGIEQLYPFQYVSGDYVGDYYVFDMSRRRNTERRVLPLYHDDWEIWLSRIKGFTKFETHMKRVA